jgi:hypothetical protein
MTDQNVTNRGPIEDSQTEKGHGDKEKFLAKAVKRFHRAETAEGPNRIQAVDDLKFKRGEQWPEMIKAQRTIEKRPCLTINKMKTFVHQITNDQRQNRPAINISPVGDKADRQTAKMLKGLIRQIERKSDADVAYDTGFENSVSNGWGYWRVLSEYEFEDSFDQVLRIARIRNPFRVYLDPDAQMPDGSDAKWCFISDLIIREEFESTWPNANPMPWQEGTVGDESFKLWSTQTHVRIAEYFQIVSEKRTLVALTNGHVGFKDELDDEIAELIQLQPDLVKNEREVDVQQVQWSKITSHDILEQEIIPCKWIPVVRVIGDESDVEGQVNYAGIVRDAKDPQRMYNFWSTSETELIALAPKAPWIMEEGQIEGHENRWRDSNTKSLPYLLYKGVSIGGKQAPAPQRNQFAGPPAGVVTAKEGAAQDMQAVTGIRFDATLNERMYDESGKALRELKRVGDLGSFHYIDNLARSLRHTGRILIDWIPHVYDTRRVLTILREDDTEETATIDPQIPKAFQQNDTDDGGVERLYNPKLGEYDVAVTVGPSYATKRAEAADSLLSFISAFPAAAEVSGDLIAKNMDWPGAEEIAERLETLLPPGMQDKGIRNLPQEARGIVMNMQRQLQQVTQERDKAAAMLGEQDKDRAVQQDKINKDYDAKMKALDASWRELIAKLMAEQQEAITQQQQGNGEQMAKILMEQEAKFQQIIDAREASEAKMRDDFLLGAAKIEATRKAAEEAAAERAAQPGPDGKPKKRGKRTVRKVEDGVWEMVEEVAAQAAQQNVTQRVMKGPDGSMSIEDMG